MEELEIKLENLKNIKNPTDEQLEEIQEIEQYLDEWYDSMLSAWEQSQYIYE